jgi:WD40 repeat protein
MSLRNKRNLLVAGLLAVLLVTVLISRLHPRSDRQGQGGDEERSKLLVGHTLPVQALVFHPDGVMLTMAASYLSGRAPGLEVTDWNVATGQPGTKHPLPHKAVTCLSFAPGGRMLAVAFDRAVQLWDVATVRLVHSLEGHAGRVQCLAFPPDGTLLASGGHDRTVRLWDLAGYRPTPR